MTPYHRNIARSLHKEAKIYFYDNGMVLGNEGIRFENFVAISLLKHLNAIEDYQGKRTRLRTMRTKDKKEVDFVLEIEGKPATMIEVKLSDSETSAALRYFHKKYAIPAIQLVKNLHLERVDNGIELRNAYQFLSGLKL